MPSPRPAATADYFDAPALGFWDRLGRRTVERISLQRGAAVLDACCGAGASAIPAAEAVGPNGRVLGVDLGACNASAGVLWARLLDTTELVDGLIATIDGEAV